MNYKGPKMVVTQHFSYPASISQTRLKSWQTDIAIALGVYGKGWNSDGTRFNDVRDGDTGILLSEVIDTASNTPYAAILLDRNGAVVVMHRDGVRPLDEADLTEMASKQGGLRYQTLYSTPADGLQICEGHCSNDEDCAGDLKCYHRNREGPMPYCVGTPYTRYQLWAATFYVGYCYQDVTTVVTVGSSSGNLKCIDHSVAVLCDADAGDLGKRAGTHKAGDTFVITTNGKQVCAQRTDSNSGWGMNLQISCKRLGI